MVKKDLMDKPNLLKALDSLGYSARMNKIALLGREHQGSPAFSALLQSLLEGGFYEAQLALTGADATEDTEVVAAALQHAAAGVRKRAAGLLAKFAEPAEIEHAMVHLSPESRRQLWRGISQYGRRAAAEQLLPLVFARWGAQEAAVLLPACSEETVYRWIRTIGYALKNWHPIAKRYPGLIADYFRETLESTPPREKGEVWRQFSSAMEMLSQLRPDVIMACALQQGPFDILPPILRNYLGTFIPAHTDMVHKLLVREESRCDLLSHGIPAAILAKRKYFSAAQWTEWGLLLADEPAHLAKLLHALAPSRRQAVYESAFPEDKRQLRIVEERVLDELPHDLRDREAARMLGLRQIKDYRQQLLRITARRSIRHSREILEQATRVSNADERGQALVQLIKSSALSRQGMTDTLLFLTRFKDDQDPVRQAVMTELSASAVFRYSTEHIQSLTVLVDSVVEARDTSYATRAATEKLAFSLLRRHAPQPENELFGFALQTLVKLIKQNGQFALPSFEQLHLPLGVEAYLFGEIYTSVAGEIRRESYTLVFQLAQVFGKRGYNLDKLQQLLQEATQAKNDSTAAQAARYWLAPYKTRDQRVRELLDRDRSFITVDEVFRHLHSKRQEWLDPFISGTAVKGKFLSGKTIYLLPAEGDFYRWLPRQQQAFGSLLARVARDAKRSLLERTHAIRRLAQLPDVSFDGMLDLLQDKEVAIAEAVLYGLSLTEEPEKALPLLLTHLDGDRARIAMYAIPRCLRRINPALSTSLLKELLNRDKLKITVRKEAIRLLGTTRSDESVALVQQELDKPQVHKDVRIAIGFAARQLLDDERCWTLLERLAASSEGEIVNSLLAQNPHELPPNQRSRYLAFIMKTAEHEEVHARRMAFYYMGRWGDGNEAIIAAAAARAIGNFADNTLWAIAMRTLVDISRDAGINDVILGIVQQMVNTPIQEEWNANIEAERDMPQRQRLQTLIYMLTGLPPHTRLVLLPLYEGMITRLAPDETHRQVVVNLSIAAIDWQRVKQAAAGLHSVVLFLEQHPHLLHVAYHGIVHNLNMSIGYWQPEVLLAIVDEVNAGEDYTATYLSLSLLEVAGKDLLWNKECVGRLRAYREHPLVAIRSLALDMWTAIE